MDKARREELGKLKHKKRCIPLKLKPEEHYCYKAQSVPCSCYICSSNKFDRKIKHKGKES